MAFSPVPNESKNQINKAGLILAKKNLSVEELKWAQDLAERWRACHAYPINTFRATLTEKLRHFSPEPIIAQRLKRMPTIIDKLNRYPAMKLTTMQDIGGIRAVLNSITQVRKLAGEYKAKGGCAHELIDDKNYIELPRSE